MIGTKTHKHNRAGRRGAVIIELAVCLPTLIFTFMAAIQAADMVFLKQTLQVASYETARAAIRHDAESSTALASGQQILSDRQINCSTITLLPQNITDVERGQIVSVTVDAPIAVNTVLPDWFGSVTNMTVTTKMVKE